MPFGKWSATEEILRQWDEALLMVLRMQPSEIDALDLEDYWFWTEVADREISRRVEQAEQLARK